jgi:hypothetical protein
MPLFDSSETTLEKPLNLPDRALSSFSFRNLGLDHLIKELL